MTTFLSLKLSKHSYQRGIMSGKNYSVRLKINCLQNLLYTSFSATVSIPNYPKLMADFYLNYSMLVLNSFGLQNAIERSAVDIGHFFMRCHASATTCATIARDEIAPRGFLKYSPDSHSVMVSYAVLSLLKVCVRVEHFPFD